jgi:hypothetical protein
LRGCKTNLQGGIDVNPQIEDGDTYVTGANSVRIASATLDARGNDFRNVRQTIHGSGRAAGGAIDALAGRADPTQPRCRSSAAAAQHESRRTKTG